MPCTDTPEDLRKELLAAHTKDVQQKQKELERKAERERIYKAERDEADAQKARKQSKVTDWQDDLRKSLDKQAARAFYHSGIPFYVAQDPEMEKFITDLIAATRAGLSAYKLPRRERLSSPLLDADYAQQQTQFSKFFDTDHWTTLQTDGWRNVRRKAVTNYCLTGRGGTMFLAADYPDGNTKDGEYLAKKLDEVQLALSSRRLPSESCASARAQAGKTQ